MTINDVIILPVNQQIIDKTMKNVVKKLNHTNISLMYNRTPVEFSITYIWEILQKMRSMTI